MAKERLAWMWYRWLRMVLTELWKEILISIPAAAATKTLTMYLQGVRVLLHSSLRKKVGLTRLTQKNQFVHEAKWSSRALPLEGCISPGIWGNLTASHSSLRIFRHFFLFLAMSHRKPASFCYSLAPGILR